MAQDPAPPRDAFEASLLAKIAAWQAVLDSYRAATALDGPLGDGGAAVPSGVALNRLEQRAAAMDLPVGVFRDKSIKEAIEIYLRAGRRKQANKDIAAGLQKGGIATTSTNFEATVATALGRMKDEGIVLRFPDGWDLAESYPDSLRSRLGKDSKAPKQRRSVAQKKAAKPKANEPESADKTNAILSVIAQHDGVNLKQIQGFLRADRVEASPDYVRVVTRRLVGRGLVTKQGKLFRRTAVPY